MPDCPSCHETMNLQYKDILHPAEDIFTCEVCKIQKYRYEGTDLERPTDPKFGKEGEL